MNNSNTIMNNQPRIKPFRMCTECRKEFARWRRDKRLTSLTYREKEKAWNMRAWLKRKEKRKKVGGNLKKK